MLVEFINYSICDFENTFFRNILENPEMPIPAFRLRSIQPRSADLGRSGSESTWMTPHLYENIVDVLDSEFCAVSKSVLRIGSSPAVQKL